MAMRTFEDIIPPSKRKVMETETSSVRAPAASAPPERGRRFPYLLTIIVLAVVGLSVGALYLFSGARIEVDPTTDPVLVSTTLTALAGTSTLPFQIVSVEKMATQSVQASGSETVNTSAQGVITVYNEQNKAQALVANTRFESANGLVFRVHTPVTVPAEKGGKPGTLQATVYADKTGAAYNVGPGSFTIPGFAGTAQFTKVYAKSVAGMSGGFSGTRPKVDETAAATTGASLKTALAGELKSALAANLPQGYVLVPGADFETYTTLSPSESNATGVVDIREQGRALAVAFPMSAIASAVAGEALGAAYHGEAVTLSSVNGLTLSAEGGAPSANASTFSFSLAGNTTIVWSVEPSKIASAVTGKTRDSAQVILSGFPEIKKALLVLHPFWMNNFPSDPQAITVVVNAPR